MKKTYIAPVTKVMRMSGEEMLISASKTYSKDGAEGLVRQRGSRSTFILDDFDE